MTKDTFSTFAIFGGFVAVWMVTVISMMLPSGF